jgi:hypothetical protein
MQQIIQCAILCILQYDTLPSAVRGRVIQSNDVLVITVGQLLHFRSVSYVCPCVLFYGYLRRYALVTVYLQ